MRHVPTVIIVFTFYQLDHKKGRSGIDRKRRRGMKKRKRKRRQIEQEGQEEGKGKRSNKRIGILGWRLGKEDG